MRGRFGPINFGGRTLGLKVHEFRKYVALPTLTGDDFEIALAIDPGDWKDRELLVQNGWRLTDPSTVGRGPLKFRDYVMQSAAEFSVAQGVYVDTRSGWFSDRTVRYLAAGKPALVQDTGAGKNYRWAKVCSCSPRCSTKQWLASAASVATTSATLPPRGSWPRRISIPTWS